MNTRLQVEHPVTELVYGVDLVQWQLRIASGERLTLEQSGVQPRGWAIESRIYAEDPYNDMLPSTGTLTAWTPPPGSGVRLDSGVEAGSEVSVYYDPMLAKLITWGTDRMNAIVRMERALQELVVAGVRTNVPLLEWIVRDDAYRAGDTTTQFLPERLKPETFAKRGAGREMVLAAASAFLRDGRAPWRIGGVGIPLLLNDGDADHELTASALAPDGRFTLSGEFSGPLTVSADDAEFDGKRLAVRAIPNADGSVEVTGNGGSRRFTLSEPPSIQSTAHGGPAASGRITSPMPGKIVKMAVTVGDVVEEHALLLVLEAMKMEHRIEAPSGGTVKAIFVKEGELVTGSAPLVELE
jgi:acetyl/propionyl-CoA carboxylase alpha subunit